MMDISTNEDEPVGLILPVLRDSSLYQAILFQKEHKVKRDGTDQERDLGNLKLFCKLNSLFLFGAW